MSASFVRNLVDLAARPYRAAGRFPWYFARGKLRGDPAFAALLEKGLIPSGRLLDLGCGQGLLASWLLAARRAHQAGNWPPAWPEPPRLSAIRGIELVSRDVSWARQVFGKHAEFELGDICTAEFGTADTIVILDVLHYIDPAAQDDILRRVRAALSPGGVFVTRVGDADGGLPFRFSKLVDGMMFLARSGRMTRFHCRPPAQWREALTRLGFSVEAYPMDKGTPFANVMLVAKLG